MAGFGGHPGDPDPNRRDANKNAKDLRNNLRNLLKNVQKSGKSITDYLKSNGWTQAEIDDFYDALNRYIKYVLPTDEMWHGVGIDLAKELEELQFILTQWR